MLRQIAALTFLSIVLSACSPAVSRGGPSATNTVSLAAYAININTASVSELVQLPRVGEKTAARIVEYRSEHGPFQRPEELLLVQGISDAKFREMRPYVVVK